MRARPALFEEISCFENVFFYENRSTDEFAAVRASLAHTDPETGMRYQMFAVSRPAGYNLLYLKESELASKYKIVSKNRAKVWWQNEQQKIPPVEQKTIHLLSDEEWEQIKTERIPPKEMAKKLVKLLRPNRPDYLYLKQVFKHTRQMLELTVEKSRKRLPELLTDTELIAFYEAVWNARNTNHLVMIKLLIYTGIRNAELTNVQIKAVDLTNCTVRIEQGKGKKDRYVLFPMSFRGELAQYVEKQKRSGARFLFESNRLGAFSTRRIRQIIKEYSDESGIEKRIYPHLFRHQIITYLTRKGIISPKLQLLSGHSEEKSLAIYRDLALADVAEEYESAMQMFPVR